jgi:uracil-DNA glycosylase
VNIPNKPLESNIIETEAPQNKSINNITIVGEQPTEQQIQSGIIFEGAPSSGATIKTKI